MKKDTKRAIFLISGMNILILLILFLFLYQSEVFFDLKDCLVSNRCSNILVFSFVPFLIILSSLYYIYIGYKKLIVNNWIFYSSIIQLFALMIFGSAFFIGMIGFVTSQILFLTGLFGLMYVGPGVSVIGLVMFIIGFFIRLIKKV